MTIFQDSHHFGSLCAQSCKTAIASAVLDHAQSFKTAITSAVFDDGRPHRQSLIIRSFETAITSVVFERSLSKQSPLRQRGKTVTSSKFLPRSFPSYGFVTTCSPSLHPPLSWCSSAPGVQERVRKEIIEHEVQQVPVTPLDFYTSYKLHVLSTTNL